MTIIQRLLKGVDDADRGAQVILTSLILAAVCFVVALLEVGVRLPYAAVFAVLALAFLGCATLPRWLGKVAPAAHGLLATVTVLITLGATLAGGTDGPVLSVLLLLPLTAAVLLDLRASAVYSATAAAGTVLVVSLQSAGVDMTALVDPATRLAVDAVLVVSTVALAGYIAAHYARLQVPLDRRLQRAEALDKALNALAASGLETTLRQAIDRFAGQGGLVDTLIANVDQAREAGEQVVAGVLRIEEHRDLTDGDLDEVHALLLRVEEALTDTLRTASRLDNLGLMAALESAGSPELVAETATLTRVANRVGDELTSLAVIQRTLRHRLEDLETARADVDAEAAELIPTLQATRQSFETLDAIIGQVRSTTDTLQSEVARQLDVLSARTTS